MFGQNTWYTTGHRSMSKSRKLVCFHPSISLGMLSPYAVLNDVLHGYNKLINFFSPAYSPSIVLQLWCMLSILASEILYRISLVWPFFFFYLSYVHIVDLEKSMVNLYSCWPKISKHLKDNRKVHLIRHKIHISQYCTNSSGLYTYWYL